VNKDQINLYTNVIESVCKDFDIRPFGWSTYLDLSFRLDGLPVLPFFVLFLDGVCRQPATSLVHVPLERGSGARGYRVCQRCLAGDSGIPQDGLCGL